MSLTKRNLQVEQGQWQEAELGISWFSPSDNASSTSPTGPAYRKALSGFGVCKSALQRQHRTLRGCYDFISDWHSREHMISVFFWDVFRPSARGGAEAFWISQDRRSSGLLLQFQLWLVCPHLSPVCQVTYGTLISTCKESRQVRKQSCSVAATWKLDAYVEGYTWYLWYVMRNGLHH